MNADTAVGDAVTNIPTDSETREQIHQDRKHAGLSTDNSSDMSRSAGEAESNAAASDTLATRSRRWSFCHHGEGQRRRQRARQPAAPPNTAQRRVSPRRYASASPRRHHRQGPGDRRGREPPPRARSAASVRISRGWKSQAQKKEMRAAGTARFLARRAEKAKLRQVAPRGSAGQALLRDRVGMSCSSCRDRVEPLRQAAIAYIRRGGGGGRESKQLASDDLFQ